MSDRKRIKGQLLLPICYSLHMSDQMLSVPIPATINARKLPLLGGLWVILVLSNFAPTKQDLIPGSLSIIEKFNLTDQFCNWPLIGPFLRKHSWENSRACIILLVRRRAACSTR